MSIESLMGLVQRLNASTETLAALGAELRLRRDDAQADPETRQLLQETLRGIDPGLLEGVSPQQEAVWRFFARTTARNSPIPGLAAARR